MHVCVGLRITRLLLKRRWLRVRLVSVERSQTSMQPILLLLAGPQQHYWWTIQGRLPICVSVPRDVPLHGYVLTLMEELRHECWLRGTLPTVSVQLTRFHP